MAGFPKPGETFGRYQVVRQIGRGGMGAVFEAIDPVLQRSVAIKIVLPNFTDDESYRERFEREAAVLAQLRSRHILQIHEYGEHEDALYLVTEFFPDGDLQSWLTRNGPLDRDAALTLVAQVCEGLYDAHEAGVVHRDVKPSNVLLWERKGRLIPYLCDFGIATSESHRLTRTGTMIGSLPYMAPERHLGDPADQRGDIYSAGCLLLAVLTGDAPFSGSDFQVMEAHIRKPAPQLDMADDLDVAINKVLAKALQKDPADRYPDAASFERALNRLIQPGSREAEAERPEATLPRGDVGHGDLVADATTLRPASRELRAVDISATQAGGVPTHDETTMRPRSRDVAPRVSGPAAPVPVPRQISAQEPEHGHVLGEQEETTRRHGALASAASHATLGVDEAVRDSGDLLPGVGAVTGEARRHRRRRLALVLGAGAVALLLVIGGVAYAMSQRPQRTPEVTRSVVAPSRPFIEAVPGYREVTFTISTGSSDSLPERVEVDTGKGWRSPTATSVVIRTAAGGQRACVRARAVASDESTFSAVRRRCARSAPAAVALHKLNSCTISGNRFDICYQVRIEGLARGKASIQSTLDCPDGTRQYHDIVKVGADGHGAIAKPFGVRTTCKLTVRASRSVSHTFRLG